MKGRRVIAVLIALLLSPALGAGCAPAPASPAAYSLAAASTATAAPLPASATPHFPTSTPKFETEAAPSPTGVRPANPEPLPSPEAPLIPVAEQSPPQERTRYTLTARLDYNRHSLAVEQGILYPNTTGESLTSIPLVIDALRYPHVFELIAVTHTSGEKAAHRLKDTTLTLTLAEPLQPGASAEFFVAYSLALPDVTRLPKVRPYPLGYTTTQANLGDWYPFIPPYVSGRGWLINPPAYFGEYLVADVADFDVAIRLEGNLTDVVVAAAAPAEKETREGEEWLRYRHLARRNFAWSASPHYEVLTRTVETGVGQSTVVASYFFAFHDEAGQSLLETMVRALPLYARLFGAYPHPQLSGVQADFLDGMEYDGLFFLSTDFYNWHKDTPDDFLMALGAHETAHQWWMGLVGSDPAETPWLDEALCTYSEMLYYENVFPEALDWWWAYRVNYYEPQGPIDIRIYDVPADPKLYRLYRDPVYLRGAQFVDELRQVMGDEAFFAALRLYAGRYAYRLADRDGFFEIMRAHTSQDLSPLIAKYFQQP